MLSAVQQVANHTPPQYCSESFKSHCIILIYHAVTFLQ
jgi:hypothetical protein